MALKSLISPTISFLGLGLILIPTIYLHRLYENLSQTTTHQSDNGILKPSISNDILSLPSSAIQNKCISISDSASRSIATSRLSTNDTDKLVTLYLRYTMQRFSQLPQTWFIRLMTPSSNRFSFQKPYLATLNFEKGDRVCGLYSVILRDHGRVEFSMQSPGSKIEGRLVFIVEEGETEGGKEMVFTTKTVMWKDSEEKEIMPLEKKAVFWVHELTSWWLLDLGVSYLGGLREVGEGKEREKEREM